MKLAGVAAKQRKRFKATTDSNHRLPVAPNLLNRRFSVTTPNCVWVGDITYVWTSEGWLYLAVVIDLYSRRIVGWSMNNCISRHLVMDALTMAIWRRSPQVVSFFTQTGEVSIAVMISRNYSRNMAYCPV